MKKLEKSVDELAKILNSMLRDSYDKGFCAGLTAGSWISNGANVVGPSGKLLSEALRERLQNGHYLPPTKGD